ncbi:MBG domain-containing protein, partial [Pseudomonas aeruginosa]
MYKSQNLPITKALLNVIADAKTKVYGDADPSLTY